MARVQQRVREPKFLQCCREATVLSVQGDSSSSAGLTSHIQEFLLQKFQGNVSNRTPFYAVGTQPITHLNIFQFIDLKFTKMHLSIYLLSIYLSIYHLSIHLPICSTGV
jgi:hypothetical protein